MSYLKRRQQLKEKDIELAEKRMGDWMRRFPTRGDNMKNRQNSDIPEADYGEDIKDPEFKTHYQEERQALKLAMKIAELREKKGLSQQQLAKLMGTSQQAISTDRKRRL